MVGILWVSAGADEVLDVLTPPHEVWLPDLEGVGGS